MLIPLGVSASNMFQSPTYWISLLSTSATSLTYAAVTDPLDNLYISGVDLVSGSAAFNVSKISKNGSIQWQRKISGTSGGGARSIAVDTSGNSYSVGYTTVGGWEYFQVAKYDINGSIQWQRKLGQSGVNSRAHSVAVDSADNVYVLGEVYNNSYYSQLIKYNSSGVIQWQRRLGQAYTTDFQATAVDTDSSGNVYITGSSAPVFTYSYDIQIVKYNSAGTLQWQRKLGTSANETSAAIVVDSSGNSYIAGISREQGANDFQISKYDTSGTIQWQRRLGWGGNTEAATSIALDSSGYVYVSGSVEVSGDLRYGIAKYDANGARQWQRRISKTTGSSTEGPNGIAVTVSGDFYVVGQSDATGTTSSLLAKLPSDGTKTGVHVVGSTSFTYTEDLRTDAASSLVDSSTTLTSTTTALTETSTAYTEASSSLSQAIKQL